MSITHNGSVMRICNSTVPSFLVQKNPIYASLEFTSLKTNMYESEAQVEVF
jgi:hypothetical protein